MLAMGREMIRDHPVFGVGPEMVGRVYGEYLQPNPVHTYNPHLHNVPVQIAAERGLPALAAWLWFISTAAWGLLREFRQGPAPALSAAGLGAIVAMLTAGLFEYNFGDSEFMMLFLGLISLPYAAREAATAAAASASRSAA
jgi:O-antigen ligase